MVAQRARRLIVFQRKLLDEEEAPFSPDDMRFTPPAPSFLELLNGWRPAEEFQQEYAEEFGVAPELSDAEACDWFD